MRAALVRRDAQVFGEWNTGPWMAVRTSLTFPDGVVRPWPMYVIEMKVGSGPCKAVMFRYRSVRDAVAWSIRNSPRWRQNLRWAEAVRQARRGR